MAANKFATMLHRNTNKITLVLVYVVLEWTLIALLLLNSLLSYFIIKFANYFGLKPPCFWCSRIDHFFEPDKGNTFHTDLLCEAHATEISKLGYCSNHKKLAEFQNMCEDCSSSRPDFGGVSNNFTFFPWVKEIGMILGDEDKVFDKRDFKCSCCDFSLEKQIYSPYVLIQPNWDGLEYTQKGKLVADEDNLTKKEEFSDRIGSDFLVDHGLESKNDDNGGYSLIEGIADEDSDSSISVSRFGLEELKGGDVDEIEKLLEGNREFYEEENLSKVMEDLISDEIISKEEAVTNTDHLEFFIDFSGQQLVPVELIDSKTKETEFNRADQNQKITDLPLNNMGSELDIVAQVEKVAEGTKFAAFDSMEMEETENSLVFYAKESYPENGNINKSMDMEETGNSPVFHAEESNLRYENVGKSTEMEGTDKTLDFYTKESYLGYKNVDITRAAQNSLEYSNDVQGIAAEGSTMVSSFPLVYQEVSHMPSSRASDLEVYIVDESAALDAEDRETSVLAVSGEASHIVVNETEVEVSIGTDIPDLDSTDEIQAQSIVYLHENSSTNCTNFHAYDHEHGFEIKFQQEETLRLGNLAIEISENMVNNQRSASTESSGIDEVSENMINNQQSANTESNGIDDEKIPDTPTSFDSFHHLHKKLLLLERKESGTEESLDGSFISEFEGGDGVMTVERLTTALRAERKALHAVYSELEEERSASAVAANQTMAMINRLQEEKAAMQMEALQYQRMMEEQSEYDQEALQLLNELMVKREREKQELEKELDMYRKKVMDYEAKEKMRMLRRSKDGSARSGFSSTSFSNGEDSDGVSIDLNHEVKEENGFYNHQENGIHSTPVDEVLHLGDSFGEFEEERMSILEQLKVLEDKLFTLSEDEHHHEEVKPSTRLSHENGNYLNENSYFGGEEVSGMTNGYSKETNGKHHQEGRMMGAKAKRLLPLFDAVEAENEELNGQENGFDSVVMRFELEERRVAIEEEVDQLYARMHALETDKEFLKHCISSLKKGDKGIDLLQEILQHLRDLRNMELRVKDFTDGTLV